MHSALAEPLDDDRLDKQALKIAQEKEVDDPVAYHYGYPYAEMGGASIVLAMIVIILIYSKNKDSENIAINAPVK